MESFFYQDIEKIARILFEARESKQTIFAMGNGGSGSTASHLVNDWAKGTIHGNHQRLKAIALTDNIPLMLAWANDSSYEDIFLEQLRNLMNPNDVVVGISGSGNSANVIKAIQYANDNQAITIGLTGFDGGKLQSIAQECIIVPSDNMQQIENMHLIVQHLLMLILKNMSESTWRLVKVIDRSEKSHFEKSLLSNSEII